MGANNGHMGTVVAGRKATHATPKTYTCPKPTLIVAELQKFFPEPISKKK